MLKIKSNTNKFTIIFSKKIGKKIEAEKFSIPALSFFQLQCRTFLPFSALAPFFFLFFLSGQRCLFFIFCFSPLFSIQHHFSCFSRRVALFFQPKTLFQPKNFFSPKHFFFQFSPSIFLKRLILFFFPLAPFIQDPIFSLATSHLFYLNKSLFSSNLE